MCICSRALSNEISNHLPSIIRYQHGKDAGKSVQPPSLQEFLRSRMHDHFDMVDKFGFGSFEELITTAEEGMCEIWVAVLGIIESDRYRALYAGAGRSTARS